MRLKDRISTNLRRIRLEAGLSQADLARRTGIHTRRVSSLENQPQGMTVTTLEKLADGLSVTVDDLLAVPNEGDVSPALGPGLDEAIRLLKAVRRRILPAGS